jgi:hypothetical protein
MISDFERIAEHFCATAKCKKRKTATLQVHHEPGVTWICCEHEKCACILNDGDSPQLSETLAKWQRLHG